MRKGREKKKNCSKRERQKKGKVKNALKEKKEQDESKKLRK